MVVVLSVHHPLAGRASLALADLANENFIMFDRGTVVHELVLDACHAAGFQPRIFYASLRVESVLGLVASNSGIALMMKKVVDYRGHPDVVVIPLEETIASTIVLAALKERKLAHPARLFMDFMEQAVALD